MSVIVRHLVCICGRSWRRKRLRYCTFPIRLSSFVQCTLRYEALRRAGICVHRYLLVCVYVCVYVCVCVIVSIWCVFVGGCLRYFTFPFDIVQAQQKKKVKVCSGRNSKERIAIKQQLCPGVCVCACVEGPLDGRSCM